MSPLQYLIHVPGSSYPWQAWDLRIPLEKVSSDNVGKPLSVLGILTALDIRNSYCSENNSCVRLFRDKPDYELSTNFVYVPEEVQTMFD